VSHQTREIICVAVGKGREHDFTLFKRSKIAIQDKIECLADRGYQGLLKLHRNSQTPKKKPRGGELTPQQKKQNQALASRRVVGEHVIGKLKVFRILGEKYRNRRRRFGLRLNLLASLYNLDLQLFR
jgi:DDE superfamily endonuclease